jgi:uncharacterized membrane protein HdeD (DUF308 family)
MVFHIFKTKIMELKYYDKPWLPAFKGAFLIIFGIIAMLRIFGTIKSLAVLFVFLIAMIGILLITTGVRYKSSRFRVWTMVSGILNLAFCAYLVIKVDSAKDIDAARSGIFAVILIWVFFYGVTEIVEAGLLVSMKNGFAALFALNALLTFLFGYFLYIVTGNFTSQSVFYIGLIALVFGIVNVLSSYLLGRVKNS